MENWYVPITLLPSVGFFIMATTNASNALSAEIARLIEAWKEGDQKVIKKKIHQLLLVNISLVLLYVGAVILSIAGLVAGLEFNLMVNMPLFINVLICLAIGTVILAFLILMVYAFRAVRIKREQFEDMRFP